MPSESPNLPSGAPRNPFRIAREESFWRISLPPDLVASTVDRLGEPLEVLVGNSEEALVVDLSSTLAIDSLGLGLLIRLFKACERKGVAFSVEGANANLLRVFHLCGLTRHFQVRGP